MRRGGGNGPALGAPRVPAGAAEGDSSETRGETLGPRRQGVGVGASGSGDGGPDELCSAGGGGDREADPRPGEKGASPLLRQGSRKPAGKREARSGRAW